MTYQIIIEAKALKALEKLQKRDRTAIRDHIDTLAKNPRQHGVQKLEGHHAYYRTRVGDYRVIYEIRDNQLLVIVIKVAHRRDVYRGF